MARDAEVRAGRAANREGAQPTTVRRASTPAPTTTMIDHQHAAMMTGRRHAARTQQHAGDKGVDDPIDRTTGLFASLAAGARAASQCSAGCCALLGARGAQGGSSSVLLKRHEEARASTCLLVAPAPSVGRALRSQQPGGTDFFCSPRSLRPPPVVLPPAPGALPYLAVAPAAAAALTTHRAAAARRRRAAPGMRMPPSLSSRRQA